jgi:hypothetical protein
MSARVASLEVNIGANVTGFQQAAGQVKAGLKQIESAAKTSGGALFHAEGALKGWSQAQYIASYNTERLASRASYLESRVRSGKMSVEQATSAMRGYTAEARKAEYQAMTFGEKYSYASRIVNDKAATFAMGAAKFAGMAAAIGFAGKQVYDFGKTGATIEYTAQKFDRLAIAAGSTGDVFLQQLRSATKGTVSDFELLRQGSDLLQLGLASDTKEAVRLSSVMTALGMDTGEMTLALANQSKRRLDQLGLSLTKFNEIEAKLKGSGLSKEQAFKEAFLQTAEQTVMVTGNKADSAMAPFMQFQAEGANVLDNLKQQTSMAISGDVQNFANFFKAMNAVKSGEMAWGGNMFEIMAGSKPALISGQENLSNLAMQQQEANNRQLFAANRGDTDFVRNLYGGGASTAADFLYEDAASRNARLRPTGAGGGGAPAGEGAEIDYAAMLSGGMALVDMTTKYSDSMDKIKNQFSDASKISKLYKDSFYDLHEELRRGEITSEEYKDGVKELQQSWFDGSFAADKQREAIERLNSDATVANQQFALSTLQSQEATEEQQYAFARASGLITEDAFEAQQAIDKITSAFAAGKISAEDAAAGIGKVGDWVGELDGARVSMVVDVFIVQHGTIPGSNIKPKDIQGGSCFTGDTLIGMADGSQKSIADVLVGDVVKSYDVDRCVFVDKLVVEKFAHEVTNYLDIDGLHVTPEHIVWSVTAAAWAAAGSLRIGDELMLDTGETKRITSIGFIAEPVTVYNFEVEEVHTYFAGGVLVHNAKSNNMWTGGPLNGDGFTVVGDAPGGTWTPYTEVIHNGHVYNAKEARILRDAGVLDGATYAAGGTAGSGPARRDGSRRSGGGPPGGNRTVRPGGDRHGGTLGSGASVEGSAGATAADVANQVSSETAAVVVSSQQATEQNAQLQTQQQVSAQQQTQQVLAEKLDQVVAALKKQADRNDMYTLFHSGQQTSI